ncbi:hypothetical protein E6O75_ATG06265 [Venturia nashicola]|uniref:Uncharacterized protein n=1 Tax=Venturia nashicola TaxID=86259 RepID=A0A4Z1NW30_9PEZI|nr:hypothetical protein E6O75_ATG06265 [Venturia nashicola]
MAKIIALSAVDQFAIRCYVNTPFCFPTPQSDAIQTISLHLRTCLTDFARDFPFLKGQIRPTGSRGYVEVNYNINGSDPPFFTHICSWILYSELKDSGFNIHGGSFDLFTLAPDDCGSAVFAVKVSFVDGGCIVCISPHHSFFDGRGAFRIAELFASYCKEERKCSETGALHDRLQLLHGKSKPITHEPFLAGSDADGVDSDFTPPGCATRSSLISVIFSVADQTARELRTILYPHQKDSHTVSRLDVITSLLFMRIMKSRSPNLPAGTICSLNTAVDTRSRLNPPVSNDYLGNVVIGACLDVRFRDSALDPDNGVIELQEIAQIALTLRANILAIDDTAMRNYIACLESRPNIKQYFHDTHPANPEASLMCSSWAAWPAHELDFGSNLGKAEAVRCHTGDSSDLRVQPRHGEDGDWEVTAVLEQSVVEKLKGDGVLNKWYTGDARHLMSSDDEPRKGKGLHAHEDISRGTRLLAKSPLLAFSRNFGEIIDRFDALCKEDQDGYMNLQHHHPWGKVRKVLYLERAEKIVEIYHTNAFGTRDKASVNAMGSRSNRCCAPNIYSLTNPYVDNFLAILEIELARKSSILISNEGS